MLHLADDPTKVGQIGAEDFELVHPAKFMHHASRALEELEKSGTIVGIGAKFRCDQFTRPP